MTMPHPAILLDLQYLPCLQYWSKFTQFETIYLEQHENFVKSSYRNRCHIAGVNGPLRLSIPLAKGKNEQQNIRQVTLSEQDHWRSRHWHSIRSAYGNAPYWDFYADQLEPHFKTKTTTLFEFNYQLFQTVYQLLGLTTKVQLTESYQSSPPANQILDFRAAIHPKPHRAKSDPQFQSVPYLQVFSEKNGFLPNLSILDLLFCTGPEAPLLLEQMVK